MKQLEAREVVIGENRFYIRPFPAFKAANLSGELATLIAPIISGVSMLAGDEEKEGKNIFDMDIKDTAPAITAAFSSISGDKIEKILKHLLLSGNNVSVEIPNERVQLLTEEIANEVFCADVQDMFLLAFEVIKTNYSGFFKKLGTRFGSLGKKVQTAMPSTENMAI
mgnify:FL=1